MNIRKILLTPLVFRFPSKHMLVHRGQEFCHCIYLGAASYHGGLYGIAAGLLLFLVLVGFLMGEEAA